MRQQAGAKIPPGFDFAAVPCLSAEEVEKLSEARPPTLADAAAIPGITPKALLYVHGEMQIRARARAKEAAAKGVRLKDGAASGARRVPL